VRAFPFSEDVEKFLAAHELLFVVEQNRDAQLRTLLVAEGMLPQEKLTPKGLADLIRSLDRGALLAMADRAKVLGKPEATRVVADRCVELAA